ncbi:MAG: hypothetical protein KGL39_25305 [Patescibacteria group bacterium]|nr:hypothetical protein [Patescibacteria group bacterium]
MRLSPEQLETFKTMAAAGQSRAAISRALGVSYRDVMQAEHDTKVPVVLANKVASRIGSVTRPSGKGDPFRYVRGRTRRAPDESERA